MQQDESLRNELLAQVEAIAPILAEHALDSERLGRLDDDTMQALGNTRLLRFICPRELGGDEADPVTQMEVLEALARIDASAGWVIGILAGVSALAGAFLPAGCAQRIFANGVPPMAGLIVPRGRAEPVDSGYRVNSRWAFGSGILHADWVLAGALVCGKDAVEEVRVIMLPREQVVVHDNWQVAGFKATGSCDYSIEDVFVPHEMTFSMSDCELGKSVTGGLPFRVGFPAWVASFHFGVALGVARRSLDEIIKQAATKGRFFQPSPLATYPHVQFALGRAELELASARALALRVLSRIWDEVCAGRTPPPEQQAETRAASAYVTEIAQHVVTVAFQAAGGGALFDTNPLQRCFRDAFAAGQHFLVSQSSYRALGQFKLRQPDANPML
jgi:indole-3-acetate monooxygenase